MIQILSGIIPCLFTIKDDILSNKPNLKIFYSIKTSFHH